ncbi:hypothetical protein B0H14DRAFT_3515930 [Mycena olivaceomarginata]|nr:hypothetical protein B0H14DRAFT_3515930 [Mycena olivaceomarginata]
MGPTPLRPAGLIESWHITRHFLGLDSCVLVSARYIRPDGPILSKEHLFAALHKVIEQHPILSVMVQNEESKPSFIRLDKIELPLVVQFSDNNDLEAAIQRQLATRFDTAAELPLWRVEVLNDSTVILAYHHGIGDGLSGVAFHRSLLAALQDVGDASGSLVVQVSESLSGVLPLTPRLLEAQLLRMECKPSSKTPEFTPHVKLITFSGEEMAAFAKICRSHNATVTSAFYVLAAAILSRLVPPHSPQYKTLTAVIAISLRGVAGASADAFCDYVSGHMSTPPINPAFQWPAAARYAAELQRQKTAVRQEIGMIYLIASNIAGFMKGMLGGKRRATFEISNTGRVPAVEGAGPWRVERMVFAQSDLVVGAALKINVTGDPTGAVTVALTWGEGRH